MWDQGVFGLTFGTLESLVQALDTFEFAVLVLSRDDLTVSHGQAQILGKGTRKERINSSLGSCERPDLSETVRAVIRLVTGREWSAEEIREGFSESPED